VSALLEGIGLDTYYGASHVLHGVSLALGAGETVTLMGRNGMGKTTTIRSLLGLTPPRSGEVRVRGQPVTGWPAHRIAAQGIALVPEGRGIFPTLTVLENLVVAARAGAWTRPRALELFPRLRQRLKHLGSQLSGGEQQMLAIARALLTNPRLLLMDEPSEGLAPRIVEELVDTCRTLVSEGIGLLLVEQNLGVATALADRILVMVSGQVALETTAAELAADEEAQRRYLGVEPLAA
jgi:branched-chain amino acid transport system ATP-binding protein